MDGRGGFGRAASTMAILSYCLRHGWKQHDV
jgi:hypothetical protein